MRLLGFEVAGLFERFNYRVELNQEDRITILHGPNGFGKTTVLQMLGHVLAARFTSLAEMPFHSFGMHFDTGMKLELIVEEHSEKENDPHRPRSRPGKSLRVALDGKTDLIKPLSARSRMRLAEMAGHFVPGYERVSEDQWLDPRAGQLVTLEMLMERYGDELPPPLRDAVERDEGEAVRSVRSVMKDMRVFVIDTQRLIANRNIEMMEEGPRSMAMRRRTERREADTTPAVMAYAGILREEIRDHLRSYGVKASELDRSLPRRILSGDVTAVDTDELRARYNAVVERRQGLVKAGLLQEPAGWDMPIPQNLDDLRKQVFRVYLDDMETKLDVFSGFAERVQLFTDMINGLFKYKRLEVGPELGFHFRSDEGRTLSPANLSSGEQHQLVLLFDLLFRVKDRALILVDEPEISLHVEWQQRVLGNFHAISRLRDLDFLIATHSPDIIHDRWDLTVGLGEGVDA